MKELLKNTAFLAALETRAPVSKFSGKPMTPTFYNDLRLTWDNSKDTDWDVKEQDDVYPRRQYQEVTDEDIIAAAKVAGIDVGDVGTAFLDRIQEREKGMAKLKALHDEYLAGMAWADDQQRKLQDDFLVDQHPELRDPELANAAVEELAEWFRKFPQIDSMTPELILVDSEGYVLAAFRNLIGMQAWLLQNGHRPSVDDRQFFVDNEK
jgi:hypothetical protein